MPRLRGSFSRLCPALCATLALHLNAAESAPLECRWADQPPAIDGRDDDAVWSRASVASAFRQAWLPGAAAPREGTRVRLLWDREWLYFFAEMDDADVTATVREHDGPMWQNDVVEIFLRPSRQHTGYYEFEVNPHGAVFDAFFPGTPGPRDPEQFRRGTFHLETKVIVRGTLNASADRDGGWTVEGRIPWGDFNPTGGRPAPGETWQANLARINGPAPASEFSCTAAITRLSFHRTDEYHALRFVGPEPLSRARWENRRLVGAPEGATGFRATRAWPRLFASSLVAAGPTPDPVWLWYVEQDGGRDRPMRLRRFRAAGNGSDAETLLEPDEHIYNFAFHPRFAENGYVYLGTNGPRWSRPRSTRVVRYTVRDGRPDARTRTVILEWPSDGHNGGALAFANDGRLFVASGDGSSHSDLDRVGQDPASLRSKILRIDVDRPANGKPYSAPADNPFVGDARFAPETWAYGLRNPWRLTYDAASDQLWAGENGQDHWEYARLVRRGENYGWSVYEGAHPFAKNRPLGPHPVTLPTVEFSHAEFRSLSGGVVYRGKKFPELTGAYVFGDFGTGRVWAAKHDGARLEWLRELIDTPYAIAHVTAGADGELLLVDYGIERRWGEASGGALYRLEAAPVPARAARTFPRRLSETGLFADVRTLTPAAGVLPYEINAPAWHDGATSVHHLALPGDEKLRVLPLKSWDLPDRATLAQTLTLDGRRIETRVLVKQQNDFAGYTYVWNAAQTEAELAAKAGADLELAGGRAWRVPSRAECMMCHTREANFVLTLHEHQLNRGDQLARWERLDLLHTDPAVFNRFRGREPRGPRFSRQQPNQRTPPPTSLLPRPPESLGRFAATDDTAATLEARARTYLAVNCAHCHTLNGGGNSAMNFDPAVSTERMRALGEAPQHGDLGLAGARIIAPGAAGRSVVIPRVARRGPGQMPPVGTRASDPEGVKLLVEWIASLRAE